jgi:hypothetical protein
MIEFAPWLRAVAAASTLPFIRESERMIQYLFELSKRLPPRYGWRILSLGDFMKAVKGARSAQDSNRIYWQDMARSIEAYGVIVVWRSTELMRAALTFLNGREVLAPAVLSRSVIELAATMLLNANMIRKTVTEATGQDPGAVVLSEELEKLILRMLHGTRLGDPSDEIKQTNVLTSIQRLAKHPDVVELLPVYEYLCEVAHPNVIGNARFWSSIEHVPEGDAEMVTMEQGAESPTAEEIREKILWALGWSAVCVRNGFERNQASGKAILERWRS